MKVSDQASTIRLPVKMRIPQADVTFWVGLCTPGEERVCVNLCGYIADIVGMMSSSKKENMIVKQRVVSASLLKSESWTEQCTVTLGRIADNCNFE